MNRIRRRLFNWHMLLIAHGLFFITGSLCIWSLTASARDKQFDTLVWLALLSGHALLLYRRRWPAFLLHPLMFSAGLAAVWVVGGATTMQRVVISVVWFVFVSVTGMMLYRSWMHRRIMPYVEALDSFEDYPTEQYVPPTYHDNLNTD
jgi:hypothetical protein